LTFTAGEIVGVLDDRCAAAADAAAAAAAALMIC